MKRKTARPDNPHVGLRGLALELARAGVPLRKQVELSRQGADLRDMLEQLRREPR